MRSSYFTKFLCTLLLMSIAVPSSVDAGFKLFRNKRKYVQPIDVDLSSYEELIFHLEKLNTNEISIVHIKGKPILKLDLEGSFSQELTESKRMIVRLVDELLYRINRDSLLRGSLKSYPLDDTNIDLVITSTSFQINHLYHSLIKKMQMKNGEIVFLTGGTSPMIIKKSFDDCVADNQQLNPHLDDDQWDNQIEDSFSSIEKQLKISLREEYQDNHKSNDKIAFNNSENERLDEISSNESNWFSVGSFEPMIKELREMNNFTKEIQIPVSSGNTKAQVIQLGNEVSFDEVVFDLDWYGPVDQPSIIVYERRESPESFQAASYFGISNNDADIAHLTPDANEGPQVIFKNHSAKDSLPSLMPIQEQHNIAYWFGLDQLDIKNNPTDREISAAVIKQDSNPRSPFEEENIKELEFDLFSETFELKSIQ